MSDNIIAIVIPVIMIAIIFAWVPLLNLICPTCPRASGWQYLREVRPSVAPSATPPALFKSRIHPADILRGSQTANR
jgi:hypothetical protein